MWGGIWSLSDALKGGDVGMRVPGPLLVREGCLYFQGKVRSRSSFCGIGRTMWFFRYEL